MLEVEIIFKDATIPKVVKCDNFYTKGEMLCIRKGEYIIRYPLMNIFSVCNKHGYHIGSKAWEEDMERKEVNKK